MAGAYGERFRPQYHFSPPRNWMNDPHGLIWRGGRYHLYYQYHPHSCRWGPMHWGHAVSEDLLHWRHLPIALWPDEIGTIFTGDVVAAETGAPPLPATGELAAVYSYDDQSVGLAASVDGGCRWRKYAGNPVIASPGGNFRDPKVRWHPESERWLMAIAQEQSVQFYQSADLREWRRCGEFRAPTAGDDPWEVPDFFPIGAGEERRWVLLVSVPNAPAGGGGVRYFIGHCDGAQFHSEIGPETECWLDYGPDNYAGSTWKYLPGGHRVYIGWLNNWRYAEALPTVGWRGALTIPRELRLEHTAAGPRLLQQPIAELHSLRGEAISLPAQTIAPGANPLANRRMRCGEISLVIEARAADSISLSLFNGDTGGAEICYNCQRQELCLARAPSASLPIHEEYAVAVNAPLPLRGGKLSLRILLDHSSVEVFADGGRAVMSARVFPEASADGLSLCATGGAAWLASGALWPLQSTWRGVER